MSAIKKRDCATISNAVSEGEVVTMEEALRCIRWLQREVDKANNRHNKFQTDLALKLADMIARGY